MSLLSRLFGAKKGAKTAPAGLDERLKNLEVEAGSARPGYQGTPYNKAGDLALREGDKGRAIKYYGRAIDAFLEDAQREAARGVANKIIRVHPKAVRTLCTLTWLDLASQHRATALLHLRDYVEAAKDVDENARAAEQVYEMAHLSSQSEFLAAAADALDSLGFEDRASEVRGWVGSGGSADALSDPEEVAAACVTHAVSSNSGAKESKTESKGDGPSEAEEDGQDQPAGSNVSGPGPTPPAKEAEGVEPAADDDLTLARQRKKRKRKKERR
jgi:tetratricopeptide (TPR) repeat protein